MVRKVELIKSKEYWLEEIQNVLFVIVHCVVGYPQGGSDLTVAEAVQVKVDDLFQVHRIKFVCHVTMFWAKR